ncbi:MAG: tetratricopeptide repeat protein [Terricaulis sp.]
MQYADVLGNAIAARSEAVAKGIDDFVDGLLSYETRAANILAAAEAEPENTLANVYAAMLWMFLEAPDAAERATPFLARAEMGAGHASRRALLALAFTKAWAADDIPRAESIGAQINAEFPRDLVIAKLRQYFAFNQGDHPAMLRIAEQVWGANQDVAQMHGMIAFAYEQCHLLGDAEAAARRALDLKAKEPWAQHALAHVMLTQGRIDEGARFLEAARASWTDLNSFMLTHNHWHLGLFYLSQGRFDEAVGLYDSAIWGADKSYSQDQIGAVSYLARLELAGADVGDRWGDLADHLAARAHDAVQPFLSLQYLYGLARAARPEADALLASIRQTPETAPPYARKAWSDVALPAAEGLVAYARDLFGVAVEQLGKALPRLTEIGGSHAQRDLFEQIHLDALIRAGENIAAQQALELRRRYDPNGFPLNTALADIYGKLGLPKEASRAAARAAATRAAH